MPPTPPPRSAARSPALPSARAEETASGPGGRAEVAWRLFVALPLPASVAASLAALHEPGWRDARWVRDDPPHLTLRFLGDVAVAQVDELVAALRPAPVAAFPLGLEGVGAFPPQGAPRVLWAGVGRGHPRLFQLRQHLDDTLLRLGVAVDVRAFVPHVTLARLGPAAAPGAVAAWLRHHREWAGPVFTAGGFTLFRSELGPLGARHTPVAEFPPSR